MAKAPDDLEAVRIIISTLEAFEEASDRERIIRWVLEKVGVKPVGTPATVLHKSEAPPHQPQSPAIKNISTFVKEKNPKSDVQFAATVAYFHRFEAPIDKRKDEINAPALQEACRLVPWKRPKNPGQTLRNAKHLGLLDNGSQDGFFSINSVGENLVAMTLPGGAAEKHKRRKKRGSGKMKRVRKTSKSQK